MATVLSPDQLHSPTSQKQTNELLAEIARSIAQCKAHRLETGELIIQTQRMRADAGTMRREAIELRERSKEKWCRLFEMRDPMAKARIMR